RARATAVRGLIRCPAPAAAPARELAAARPEPSARAPAGARGERPAGHAARRVSRAHPAGPAQRRPAARRRLRPSQRPLPPDALPEAKDELSAAELRYFTDVDHRDHEALGALDPSGRGVG